MRACLLTASVLSLAILASGCGPQDNPASSTEGLHPASPRIIRLVASPDHLDLTAMQDTGTYDFISISNPSDQDITLESATLAVGGDFHLTPMVPLPVTLASKGAPWLVYVGPRVSNVHPPGDVSDTLKIVPDGRAEQMEIALTGHVTAAP